MEGLFIASYALLGGLAVLQAMILNWILRETLRQRRLHLSRLDKMKEVLLDQLPKGAPAPEFTAPLLSTGELMNTSRFKGHESILLFVNPDIPSPFYPQLSIVAHSWWHDTEGHLYIVCNGREESCRTFVKEHLVEDFAGHKVPVILDEEGAVTRSFLVKEFPQAVSLNEDARVDRYGSPVPNKVEYQVLPDRLSYVAGLLFIPTEVLLAAVHLSGRLAPFGALLGVAVLACFTVGVALNLKRGRSLPCHCFGNSKGDVISGRTLARLILPKSGIENDNNVLDRPDALAFHITGVAGENDLQNESIETLAADGYSRAAWP